MSVEIGYEAFGLDIIWDVQKDKQKITYLLTYIYKYTYIYKDMPFKYIQIYEICHVKLTH